MTLGGVVRKLTHLCIRLLRFVVFPAMLLFVLARRRCRTAPLLDLSSANICGATEPGGHRRRLGNVLQVALDVDDVSVSCPDLDIMTPQARFHRSVALIPLASRCILAKDNEADGHKDNQDARDHKRHSPRLVRRQTIVDQSLVHGWHDKISNSSTEVSQPTSQRVRSADNILIEEPRGPDLAGHETSSEDTNEEP